MDVRTKPAIFSPTRLSTKEPPWRIPCPTSSEPSFCVPGSGRPSCVDPLISVATIASASAVFSVTHVLRFRVADGQTVGRDNLVSTHLDDPEDKPRRHRVAGVASNQSTGRPTAGRGKVVGRDQSVRNTCANAERPRGGAVVPTRADES